MSFPFTSFPSLEETPESRLAELEERMGRREAKIDNTLHTMGETLAALTRLVSSLPIAQPTPTPIPTPTTVVTRHIRNDLKPALPPTFDGDRLKGRGFIHACQAYIRLRPDQFSDEQTKIQWAMTYMSQGRAQKWVGRVYHWESLPTNTGSDYFFDWDDFRSKFKTEFYPLHSDALATNKLEGTTYFQGRRLVDDYLDEFRDLITESGYTDPKTIVVKFRRGLRPAIADAIATMASGRPDDLDPDSWYEAAIRIDQNEAANEAFRSSHTAIKQKTSEVQSRNTTHPGLVPQRTFHKFAHLTPTPGSPVPMDIDAAKRTAKLPTTCYRCGKIGHISKSCPTGFDIRHLARDDIDVLMQQLNAQLDSMDIAAVGSLPEEKEMSEDESEEPQDFPKSSR